MASYFPSDLPERPQKLKFKARLSQKLASSKAKRKQSVDISPPLPSGTLNQIPFAPSAPLVDEVIYPHVLTRQAVPPTIQVPKSDAQILPRAQGFAPRLRQAVSSFKLSKSTDRDNAVPLQISNDGTLSSSTTLSTVQPTLCIPRKPVPVSTDPIDPLVERFERLRWPQSGEFTAVSSLSPESTSSSGLPPENNSSEAAKLLWHKMAASSPILTALQEEPPLYHDRHGHDSQPQSSSASGLDLTHPIVIDDDNDVEPVARKVTNPFRRRLQARKRMPSPQRNRITSTPCRNRRRSQSPSSFDSSSDGVLTPESSQDVSFPDLSMEAVRAGDRTLSPSQNDGGARFLDSRDAVILQDELDRQLAQRLQREENEAYETAQSLYAQLRFAANQRPTPRSGKRRRQHRSSSSVHHSASGHGGTQNDPIDLDSDDSDRVVFVGRTGVQERGTIDAESMDLDDDNWDWATSYDLDLAQADLDETLARQLQDEEERNQQASVGTHECPVCGDSFPIAELPSLAECTHPPQTCADCYAGWVAAQLQGSSWREAKCPESKCKVKLTYYEIQQTTTPEIFQQYDTFIARTAINEDPNFRWCRNCDSGQIHMSGEEGNIFTCASCGHKVCIIHENTWHEGETCEEYEYRSSGRKERDQRAQEAASLAAIGKLSKKCPGPNCVYSIEKNDGCDHMTCSKCRYEFCWVCLCDYNKVRSLGNSAHTEDCKYHSKRLH